MTMISGRFPRYTKYDPKAPVWRPCSDVVMRVDAHPAWDRSWRHVTFNAFVGGTRRVFVADMGCLIGRQRTGGLEGTG